MARILVLDDHEGTRRALRRVLESEGHEVLEASDGQQAWAALARDLPDLVISDVYMPEMDGIEFLIRLVDRYPAVPLIAMSGGAHAPAGFVLEDARHLGAVSTLEKPLEMGRLVGEVRRVLGADGEE